MQPFWYYYVVMGIAIIIFELQHLKSPSSEEKYISEL